MEWNLWEVISWDQPVHCDHLWSTILSLPSSVSLSKDHLWEKSTFQCSWWSFLIGVNVVALCVWAHTGTDTHTDTGAYNLHLCLCTSMCPYRMHYQGIPICMHPAMFIRENVLIPSKKSLLLTQMFALIDGILYYVVTTVPRSSALTPISSHLFLRNLNQTTTHSQL